jgi:glutathione synthase
VSLTVAVQMDPLETLNIAGDSTFALMLAGQKRGHRLFHYAATDLSWSDGRLWTRAHPVTVQRVEGDHFRFEDAVSLDLGEAADVVLMRQDPPFDLGYITATHLLERIADRTLVANDPVSVRNAPEKVFVLDYARFMPPLHGNGGKAIFRVGPEGENLSALMEVFNQTWREPHMVQAFLPDVAKGDKRIVLVDGEVAGAINRLPGAGEIRSNLAVGGSAEKTGLTPREREICAALGPELKRRGLIFVGIDVIGGEWLTEINVTSPTGIVAIERFDGTDVAGLIWDAIERRIAERA